MFARSSEPGGSNRQGTARSVGAPSDDGADDADGADGAALDALPVEVRGNGPAADQVRDFVEAVLGWQVTAGDHLPAVVRLVVVEHAGGVPSLDASSGSSPGALPSIVVVTEAVPPERAAGMAVGRAGLVLWPDDHDLLSAVVRSAVVAGGADVVGPGDSAPDEPDASGGARGLQDQVLRVGAASGGVGATTLAIAIGAQRVWQRGNRPTLVVATGPVPVPGVPPVAPDVLAGHRAVAAGIEVAGVHGLRVAAAVGHARPPGAASVDVVVDRGVVDPGDAMVDVLVARRDRAGVQAIADSPCGTVALVDDGPVSLRHVRDAVAGRGLVVVPWSVRVARANALQRIPTSLPGRWLQAVLPLAS